MVTDITLVCRGCGRDLTDRVFLTVTGSLTLTCPAGHDHVSSNYTEKACSSACVIRIMLNVVDDHNKLRREQERDETEGLITLLFGGKDEARNEG